ncbi:MAG: DUF371 domain-containing protein [Candidatus Bathyarchaeota archaeon]|nr:MAG: DUF371 domain-containing protein [Candidatus Bathyarchaeota archaeon]
MRVVEKISAYGHENIRSTHETTFEITKEKALTKRGDCIIAVGATKGVKDLTLKFKGAARNDVAKITITVEAGGVTEIVKAKGSPRLLLTHPTDLVLRKSDYVCNRTVAIRSDKAASNLSRELIEKLKNPSQKVIVTLTAEIT